MPVTSVREEPHVLGVNDMTAVSLVSHQVMGSPDSGGEVGKKTQAM